MRPTNERRRFRRPLVLAAALLGLVSLTANITSKQAIAAQGHGPKSVWERTKVPLPDAILADVATGKTTWSVGYAWTSDGDFAPQASQWVDGAWTGNKSAGLPTFGRLDGVDTASGRVWAVGTENVHDTDGNLVGFRALANRWDGKAWHREVLPLNQDAQNWATLNRVDVLPDGQVWAAGTQTHLPDNPEPDPELTKPSGVVLHFDGTRWKRFDVPKEVSYLTDLAVIDGQVWIAAESGFDSAGVWSLHGNTWKRTTIPHRPDLFVQSLAGEGKEGLDP
ncbi:hypothetical protein PV371_39025 [Streptomyces sp. TX20-6-3]|uniref:hypothetical protein n=1 Tax=Streptomyces sp. TX20-6-3 TaxID=3028705 RepID=UPI0029A21BD0|nr:hypothetical protein [Streptomyces sp. TX20-6-3]MDX2565492.1 hypothetical protein [Streptomyces sp. TX20-6-3]